jgi:hypothetical protein
MKIIPRISCAHLAINSQEIFTHEARVSALNAEPAKNESKSKKESGKFPKIKSFLRLFGKLFEKE